MGCGSGKVLPEASKRSYVSVVQSLVAFSKAHDDDDDGPKKPQEKRRGPWFSTGVMNGQPPSKSQQPVLSDGRRQDKVTKYKDKFDPRVTARYDIKALIGRGSFSRVVRVEHRATRQPFAIKMMEVEAPEGREVCASELAVLQRVSHANVIQLIEVFQFPQRVYMVLELATGTGSELSDTDMDNRGDQTSWTLRTTCGTPEYMAPEMLLRKPYTCAVDMWALGVITYILLSGSMPFEDDSRTRLYRSILRGKYSFHGDPWPSVSNLAKDFIQCLLALDSAARLTADQAIRHSWVVTMAASSSTRNLHRSISQNLRQRASRSSSRCTSSTARSGDASSMGRGNMMSLEKNLKKIKRGAASGQSIWTDSPSESHTTSSQRAPGAS
ncbi:hypothetical protein INR49_012119, partial [Caranx melampygus]